MNDPKSGFNGGQENDMQHVSETPADATRGFVTRDEQKHAVSGNGNGTSNQGL